MLNRGYRTGRGILRTTVHMDEVELVPVAPAEFWIPLEAADLIGELEQVDQLGVASMQSLAVGLYYFRLARAAVGLWQEATKPILAPPGKLALDLDQLLSVTATRTPEAESAFAMIRRWDHDVQEIRDQRSAIEHVANPPIPGKELREMVVRIAARSGSEPPSANQVRRRLGAWYRSEVRRRVGVIQPPVTDLGGILTQVAAAGRAISPQLDRELERVVLECLQEKREEIEEEFTS
jgi:hypothetical protein